MVVLEIFVYNVNDRLHWFPVMMKLCQIAYLRNWSLFLSLPRLLCCAYHVFVLYLGKLDVSVHCIAGRSNANISWIFFETPPGNLLEICSVKFVDTLFKIMT